MFTVRKTAAVVVAAGSITAAMLASPVAASAGPSSNQWAILASDVGAAGCLFNLESSLFIGDFRNWKFACGKPLNDQVSSVYIHTTTCALELSENTNWTGATFTISPGNKVVNVPSWFNDKATSSFWAC